MNCLIMTNAELLKEYDGKRGAIATEMCRRAGTIKYLQGYCAKDDIRFNSCMCDTVETLKRMKQDLRGTAL